MTIHGKRLEDDVFADDPFRPGSYGRVWVTVPEGHWAWYGCTPNGHACNLSAHEVIEHDDGTITVSPSILITGGPNWEELWHGWLEHGKWRKC